jgi:hypothetical protein
MANLCRVVCLFEKIDADHSAPSCAVDIISSIRAAPLYDLNSFAAECEGVLKTGGLLIGARQRHKSLRSRAAVRGLVRGVSPQDGLLPNCRMEP